MPTDDPDATTPSGESSVSQPAQALRPRTPLVDAAVVFAVAVALRIVLVLLSKGGPGGDFGYDQGVYYNAADALIHGRLAYHDFLLLHPPGLMLALTPVAGLGQVIGDHAAFMVGNTTFSVLGGLSALLVMGIVRRMGCSRGASLVGGLFYAIWYGAIFSEISARLEPLGSFVFLLGMFALTGPRGRRALVLGGFALGYAASVKIWWILPMIILLAWQFRARPRRDAVRALVGGVVGLVLVNGPFFVVAPTAMTRMIIVDQLKRNGNTSSRLQRFGQLSSVNQAFPHLHLHEPLEWLVAVIATAIMLGLCAFAWRHAPARVAVVLAVADIAVLFVESVYNTYYSGFAAAGLAIIVAVTYHRRSEVRFAAAGPALAAATLAITCVLTFLTIFVRSTSVAAPFPQGLGPKVSRVRCLVADSPIALIELDALSRALANDCPNWVDVTGHTYDDDRAKNNTPFRHDNRRWQKAIRRYLLSGDAFVVVRRATGLAPDTKRALERYPVLVRDKSVVVRRVRG